jgi:hypothetical protein
MKIPQFAMVCAAAFGASCASQQSLTNITNIGKEYEKANQAAVAALHDEAARTKSMRRLASAVAYINSADPSASDNIDTRAPIDSFANFVCTGVDDFAFTSAGLVYTTAYAGAVSAITTVPVDSLSGYWQALESLQGDNKPLSLPDIKNHEFQICRDSVRDDLPPKGFSAVSGRPESITTDSVIKSVEAIRTLVKDVLKAVVEEKKKEQLQAFIVAEGARYQEVLTTDLRTSEFKTQFERRRKTAIAVPYYEFIDMLSLSRTTQRVQLLETAKRIDEDLAEYDQLRLMHSPEALATIFGAINTKLKDYADGKVKTGDAVQFFSQISKELSQAKADYQSASKSVSALK